MICLFGLLSVVNATAQTQQKIDSLNHELTEAKHDTSRLLIMADYSTRNLDSSLYFAQKAMSMAEIILEAKQNVSMLWEGYLFQKENFPMR